MFMCVCMCKPVKKKKKEKKHSSCPQSSAVIPVLGEWKKVNLHYNTYSTCKTKAVRIQGHSQPFIRYWCLLGEKKTKQNTKVSNHKLSADGCHSSLKCCGVPNHQPRHKTPAGHSSAGAGLLYAHTSSKGWRMRQSCFIGSMKQHM